MLFWNLMYTKYIELNKLPWHKDIEGDNFNKIGDN